MINNKSKLIIVPACGNDDVIPVNDNNKNEAGKRIKQALDWNAVFDENAILILCILQLK